MLTQKVHQCVAPHQVQEVTVSLGSRIEIKHRARIGRVADELYKSVQIKSETTAIIRTLPRVMHGLVESDFHLAVRNGRNGRCSHNWSNSFPLKNTWVRVHLEPYSFLSTSVPRPM